MAIYFEIGMKDVKLGNIKDIQKKEDAKHGKKNISSQIIKEFGALNMSDIAMYCAMYLSEHNVKPYYTVQDLQEALTTRAFIDENLIPFLDKSDAMQKLPPAEKKRMALKIAMNIVDNERETIRIVNDYLAAQSSNKVMAHQMSPKQIKELYNIIEESVNMIEKIEGFTKKVFDESSDTYAKLLDEFYWTPDSLQTTSVWLNTLVKSVSAGLVLAMRDIKNIKDVQGLSEKQIASLNKHNITIKSLNSELNKFVGQMILWPESEHVLTGLHGLKKYFNEMEKYRKEAKEVIDLYKKRKDKLIDVRSEDDEENLAIEAKDWSDEKLLAVIRQSAKDIADITRGAEFTERNDIIHDKVLELIQIPGLYSFVSKMSGDPESELAGRLGKALNSPDLMKGRKENI